MSERVEISAVPWCDEAAEMLAEALTWGGIAPVAEQVKSGVATLFRVYTLGGALGFGAGTLAYYVLRVDRVVGGDEGVLVLAAGRAGFDLTATLLPTIELQFIGCKAIRVHTSRRGVAKKLAAQGYADGEIVLRKAL